MSNETHDSIRTKKITIVDSEGNDRIIIGERDGGFFHIVFKDSGGVDRMHVGMAKNSAVGVALMDGAGATRAHVSVIDDESLIGLLDRTETTKFQVKIGKDGIPRETLGSIQKIV